jgi:hypothetical protein
MDANRTRRTDSSSPPPPPPETSSTTQPAHLQTGVGSVLLGKRKQDVLEEEDSSTGRLGHGSSAGALHQDTKKLAVTMQMVVR